MSKSDLSNTLVIGISSTALFDLSAEDAIFRAEFESCRDDAIENYRRQMQAQENDPLAPGTAFHLVRALLKLNQYVAADAPPLVEVVVMSRNSPDTGLRILNNIRRLNLPITRFAFTAGKSVTSYLHAFGVDLFLTTRASDAQKVIDARSCAAAVLSPPPADGESPSDDEVRIAFDGDAVLFSDESELVYRTQGLDEFKRIEDEQQDTPLQEGPYAALLKKLAKLQKRLPGATGLAPLRIALITARGSPAEMRVIKTLRHWGVHIDEAFFLGGVGKAKVLQAFKPHIFFDDQDVHLEPASKIVPSGKVPYESASPLHKLQVSKWQQG